VDKGRLAAELSRLGVPYPRTVRLGAAADVRRLPEDGLAGAFLKPADSHAFQREFGRKAFRFASAGEAEGLAARALTAGLEVMVQEYVPGPPTAHYFLDGFVDRQGRVTAWFARQRLRMWPADFGNSSALVSVPLAEMEAARAGLERFLVAQRYRGIFSAEFKKDPRDGVFRLLEINARAWKFVDFAAACGVDVCHMAYRDALGLPVEPVSSYRIGATCVDAYFDRPACAAARRRGELSLLGWAHFWAGARPVTFTWDDPGPAVAWLFARLFRRAGEDP
jgi:predicted ATP-grasp superfamily ATP-dependent carboligase